MHSEYGIYLPDVLAWPERGPSGCLWSPRDILVRVRWLPMDSAFQASLQGGPEFRNWRMDTYLLAAAVDALNGANFQRGGGQGKKPEPVKRPGRRKKSQGKGLGSMVPRLPKK